MQDDAPDLAGFLDLGWQAIAEGQSDPAAPARLAVLATPGPAARLVVLRRADRARACLEVHTDAASAKAAELSADPRAELVIWDPVRRLQIRATADVALIPGSPAEWQAIPDRARRAYGGTPLPGTPLAAPGDWMPGPDPARHLRLVCHLRRIDLLQIAEPGHRRARYEAARGWQGQWLAP